MPRRDGTGPMAAGPMSGRGLGRCSGVNVFKYDAGLGIGLGPGLAYRRGFGRCFAASQNFSKTQKELLQEQRARLESQLKVVDQQLENL